MRRRDVLAGAGLVAGSLSFPAPALAQGVRRLTMVTDWPEGPGLFDSARRLAKTIGEASGGRIGIDVFPAGALVRPFETFDAVQSGVADMFHSHIGYFESKSPAFHFYSGLPFGFTTNELFAWLRFGGGQELLDELSGQFNVKTVTCCSTGSQMGGWFTREIASADGFQGLRYRMAGFGAEVLRRLGATVVLLPASDIVQSLRSGAIDACEWVGPWLDTVMGLHEVAGFYYYPAWHEPGTALTLGINTRVWGDLDESDRRLIEAAAIGEYAVSLAEFNANNARALRRLRQEGRVQLRQFDEAILRAFADISRDLVDEAGAVDDLSRKIHRSYSEFRSLMREWSEVSEGAYLGVRAFG
jgi:TRAP-type mannitol/chloroaromatic compound transport system substrate-binding protein